jgi:hypothetical protein
MGMSGHLHASAALPPWERDPSTHWIGDLRFGGPQSRAGGAGKEKNIPFHDFPGDRIPTVQPVV